MNNTTSNSIIRIGLALFIMANAASFAVTSVITRHQSEDDFKKGDTEKVVIDSTGTLRLAPRTTDAGIGDLLEDVWSIHAMLVDGRGALYVGTGPNGKVIRILHDRAVQVYPAQTTDPTVGDGFSNEHVFALGLDVADRLLIGLSGRQGRLVRLGAEAETVFEHDKVSYIYAIARDADDNIYLGTGPEGLIFRLDPFCQNAEIFYDTPDKNILSMTIDGDVLYAGADQRGVVYKLPLDGSGASVLYESEQTEITALLTDAQGNVYAAATSAQAAAGQLRAAAAAMARLPGRPEAVMPAGEERDNDGNDDNETVRLNTASSDADDDEPASRPTPAPPQTPTARTAGQIYKITPEGFVTTLFSEMMVFYALISRDEVLWLGTGGDGQLFTVNPATEEKSMVYEDTLAAQVTALVERDDRLYLGLSNPARLIRLEQGYEHEGVFRSQLIDAKQPARWGTLQLEADVPAGSQIRVASRTGNVSDPNDPTFSPWSDERTLTGPTSLQSPVGRFLQYRLRLSTSTDDKTPVVREAAVSHVVPNLAPRVTSVRAVRSRDQNKPGVIDINFAAEDDNDDDLIYHLAFRQVGRSRWITFKEDLEQTRFEWDGRTVADGRYEIRITADDRRSNCPATALTGSRISDPVVIDNTPPVIEKTELSVEDNGVLLRLTARDALTVIGKVAYSVNSSDEWISILPEDLIYDTLEEQFTIRIDELDSGPNVIAVSAADDVGNTRHKSFEVQIP